MTLATKAFSNRIAVVFDFDDTLVSDTVDSLLESLVKLLFIEMYRPRSFMFR
jgi:hypothetical protein